MALAKSCSRLVSRPAAGPLLVTMLLAGGLVLADAGRQASSTAAPPAPVTQGLPESVALAIDRAHAAAVSRPRDAEAAGRLAMTLHAYEQLSLAVAWYGVARGLDPQSARLAHLAGVVESSLGRHAAAVDAFRRAVELCPAYLPARVNLADSLLLAGDTVASRSEYRALVEAQPELAVGHYGLGRVAVAAGDRRGAVEHFRAAVDLVPQFGAARYALAHAYRALGDRDRAAAQLAIHAKHASRRPALTDPWLDQVRVLRSTARETLVQAARVGAEGRLEESIALHLRAVEQDPAAAQAHVNLVALYGRVGNSEAAERHYRAALALEANLADAHYNYGVLKASQGRGDEAADAFRRAIDANPFHAPAHHNLGTLMLRRGRSDLAAASYSQAIASDPRHRGARAGLASALASQGRHRDAIEQLLRCLVPEDPDTPRYALALSGAYASAGDRATALRHAEQALAGALKYGNAELAELARRQVGRLSR